MQPLTGSEALEAGRLTRHQLRRHYVAIYPDIYVRRGVDMTAADRAHAAWLWTRRRGVLAGRSAAALHGAKWVNATAPAQVIFDNRRPPAGIQTWADAVDADDVVAIGAIRMTSPARTALDIACRNPLLPAVTAIDALVRATRVKIADVELLAERSGGRRGIRRARVAIDLVDGGAESPRETWLRLLVVGNGLPRPQTQIPVRDEFGQIIARVDMGWEDLKIAVEYDGDHHWQNRRQLSRDIRRTEDLRELGWIVIRVTAEDTPASILGWIAAAFARRA